MSSDKVIGPPLPPMFRKEESDEDSDSEDGFSGPALPPGYKRGGPSSSSDDSEQEVSFKRAKTKHTAAEEVEKTNSQEEEDDDDDGFFGPALPPGFKKQQSSPERPPVLGPALPPGFRRAAYENDDDDDDDNSEDGEGFPGPALPPGYRAESSSSEGEDDVIGPMPSKGDIQDSVALDFERRAKRMKDKLTGEETPEVLARETWMTELPPELQHIGLGARTFKKKSGPENKDRSIWTDTPEDRERKIRERLERKQKGEEEVDEKVPKLSRKDLEMADKVSKYNETKRAESLMTLHTKTMKEKAKEKADIPVERKPFDRDADLQVNRFDDAQKERLLKKSQELNTRFSHSKDRMFL
ncbi:GPALPP motifs-containing protein 1 [Labrus mixtus]|uniref:GPALPP motifs-containing protein 1 n=1 Tax=Labrus mixtus TaxID=508554 RepID=UPI0029C0E807|nr:GPALPP motifs-containing protein 1 [Labrus mixtus]